jgi:multiple sugar transport system substrate-binding protein
LTDGFGAAVNGQGTLSDALAAAQTKTIDAMKAQSIPVVG